MKHSLRSALALLLLVFGFLWSSAAHAQRPVDSITVIQTPAGTYVCCFDLIVLNRQTDTNLAISQFRLRIISGRASILQGSTESPRNWTVLSQTPQTLHWSSNSAAADIRASRSLDGFRLCIADTGVMRIVWETENIDSVISSDTLVMACRRPDCDEAFFRVQPSQTRNVVDIDVVAGNGALRTVNTLFLHPATPGVTFSTAPTTMPPGWVRLKAKPDTLMFYSQNNGLDYNEFAENFRVELENVHADSTIRVEYWTALFGETICTDTASLKFGLSRLDTLRRIGDVRDSNQTCCIDLMLRNTHQPGSSIERLGLKVTTPGVNIAALPLAPPGWQVQKIGTDSLQFIPAGGMSSGDSVLLSGICLNNAAASSDTIAYRWTTHGSGLPISGGNSFYLCMRPFSNCDSVSAVVDSTFPSTSRCISLTVRNRNSRRDAITQFALRISNPGTQRTILTATPPAGGWRVAAVGGDSVIFTGGTIAPGAAAGPFTFCTTIGDTGTHDPLAIAWTAGHRPLTLCGDTLRVNAVLSFTGDSVRWRELPQSNPDICCFGIRFLNRNTRGRVLDRASLAITSQTSIFTSATVPAPWRFTPDMLPSFDISFDGDVIPVGGESPEFTVCLDMQQFPTRPATIPVVFRTFAGNDQVFFDTVRLVCGAMPSDCDSLERISSEPTGTDACRIAYRVTNMHTPAGPVDGVQFRRMSGAGRFDNAEVTGAAATAGWTVAERIDTLVRFSGPALPNGATLEALALFLGNGGTGSDVEISTTNSGVTLCAVHARFLCAASGVDVPLEPRGFSMEEPRPNPARNTVDVPYTLLHGGDVTVTLRDMSGRELQRHARGRQGSGSHSMQLDLSGLPAGTYYCTVRVGEEFTSRRVVVVR